MIKLKVKNFKCFLEQEINLNQLTILAGANGNGKSTSIQALLFLRHTIEEVADMNMVIDIHKRLETKKKTISLNGKYCLSLGNSDSVFNKNGKNKIEISVIEDESNLGFKYTADETTPQLWLSCTDFESEELTPEFPIAKPQFYYLNAERLGPRIQQNLQHMNFPHAGWQGEFTAQLLDREKGYWKIPDGRKFENRGSNYLNEQVNAWLRFIIPNTRVSADTNSKTLSGQVLLENLYTTEPSLATNLGFGISYVLPIIVTGLIAEKGSFFIVENPEAHLHPGAQSKIGRFLAMVANTGVNVIIETHSDHILNGVQISAAKKEIENTLVTINYFSSEEGSIQPNVQSISVSEKGELSKWPKGFFDQTQIDFAELFIVPKK